MTILSALRQAAQKELVIVIPPLLREGMTMRHIDEYYDALERAKKTNDSEAIIYIMLDSIAMSMASIADTLDDIADMMERGEV